jgi:predicted amidophosphoribosyltransferase
MRVATSLEYAGTVQRAIVAYKDQGRKGPERALARALLASVEKALTELVPRHSVVELAALPSTRSAWRRRGYNPVNRLLSRVGLRAAYPVDHFRQTADQATLGRQGRQSNMIGALIARSSLEGRSFLLFADVLTTGSTLAEAARAITEANGTVIGAAVIARTPLIYGSMSDSGT